MSRFSKIDLIGWDCAIAKITAFAAGKVWFESGSGTGLCDQKDKAERSLHRSAL